MTVRPTNQRTEGTGGVIGKLHYENMGKKRKGGGNRLLIDMARTSQSTVCLPPVKFSKGDPALESRYKFNLSAAVSLLLTETAVNVCMYTGAYIETKRGGGEF